MTDFNDTLELLAPLGFTDSSWGNDAAPSMEAPTATGSIKLWFDEADPEDREVPTWPRFCVVPYDENGNEGDGDDYALLETESLPEVIAFLTKGVK